MLDKEHVDNFEKLVELIQVHGNRTTTLTVQDLRDDIPSIDPDHVLRYMRLVDEFAKHTPFTRANCENLYCEW